MCWNQSFNTIVFLMLLNSLESTYKNHSISRWSILIIRKSYKENMDWTMISNNINIFFNLAFLKHKIVINLLVNCFLNNYKTTTRKISKIHGIIQQFSHHFNVSYCHAKISLIWSIDRQKVLCGGIAIYSIISNKENCQILILSWRIWIKTRFPIIQIFWILPIEMMLSK